MRDVLRQADQWRRSGRRVAVVRVAALEGSGPRDPGATMAVNDLGEVAGSVSGGCVESAVVEDALDVLVEGRPRMVQFGYSNDDAFAVGLTCGGTISIFIEPHGALYDRLEEALAASEPVALATQIEGPAAGAKIVLLGNGESYGTMGDAELDRVVTRDALAALQSASTATRHYGTCGEARRREVAVLIESFAPPPHMIIFGAVDFTAALARTAKALGYRVTVCDARAVFASASRFPMADEVIVDWPDRYLARVGGQLGPRDAVCVLTHDPKFDLPAIRAALATKVGYLGAMGSRRTTAEREALLREVGVDDEAIARVMAPIGLDIGARTPEETAVSICAEIVAVRSGNPAPSLRDGVGPIHR